MLQQHQELRWPKAISRFKKQLPCAVYLDGQYGSKNIYAGVPVIIGKNGVEKVIEIKLSDKEKEDFKKSIKSVEELFNAAKKIDLVLNKKILFFNRLFYLILIILISVKTTFTSGYKGIFQLTVF